MNQDPSADSAFQATLLAALSDPGRFPHPVTLIERLETHISHIILAGDYAYKIKKPLNLGFLDFTTLERRKYYCETEFYLNRRLAPDLYLDCIPICGSAANPILNGNPAEAVEYAVKMRRFPQQALLDRQLAAGNLKPRHMDALAQQLAKFYGSIDRTAADAPFGSPAGIHNLALENFQQTRPLLQEPDALDKLNQLEFWTRSAFSRLQETLAARKRAGFIRECHGDLHLGNMILQDDRIIIFDCIEFNEELRWIDIMNDLAFAYMDLCRRGAPKLARRLLNTYLEFSGDYEGLAVFPYYLVYRAMVRTKIAAIRLQQPGLDAERHRAVQQECQGYLDLALAFTEQRTPFLLITHGVSGSGKTYLSSGLLEVLEVIRIRSDVERKRLFGLGPQEASHSALNQGLYTAEASRRTYERLRELAAKVLDAGYPVIVDAAFLETGRRQVFRALATERRIPFVLLACRADPEVLRARVAHRQARGADATEADLSVLEQQLISYSPPAAEEAPLYAETDAIEALREAILERVRTQINQ